MRHRQVYSTQVADGQLALEHPPREFAEEGRVPGEQPLQDIRGVRAGVGGEDPVLLEREEHGFGEVLLDGGQLRGHRQPAQRGLFRQKDADLLHQEQGVTVILSDRLPITCHITALQYYSNITAVQYYSSTILQQYNTTAVQYYSSTILQQYNITAVHY
jgi:hypothetical protein